MGNYCSCIKPQGVTNKAKLVDSQGEVTLIELHTTVAEIMLDNPGFALAPVHELVKTRRIPVVKADDVLLARKVYLLVPVDKVNARLSDLQLEAINSVVSCNGKIGKRTRAGSKVSPVGEIGLSGEDLENVVKGLGGKFTGLAGQRNRFTKAWAPVLEPILEV